MPAPRFVHLRLHTEYSIVDGMARVDDAVAAAAGDGMPALAITDAGNLFGAIKFFLAAREKGVQPLIGCDLAITNERNRDQPSRVVVLCRDAAGYLTLCEIVTRAYSENQWRGRAEVRREWLKGALGLIVLSGAESGDVGAALLAGATAQAESLAREWADDFPGSFYLELQRADPPRSAAYIRAAVALAGRLELPVVATHPVQFVREEEFTAHEARVCIAQGWVLGDARRPRDFRPSQYFKTQAQMAELFADLPEALENSVEIARRCAFEFSLGKPRLPDFPTPDGEPVGEYLRALALEGLERHLAESYPDPANRDRERARYLERLDYEVATIGQMGFPGYFLIVADFINWAKENGVPVGPGARLRRRLARGLVAGHHGSRPASLRASLRALPQPGAGFDARLRHRLLPGGPRPGDRLRAREVRGPERVADIDLRHHGGQGRGARRRARPRHGLRRGRPHREADPLRTRDHARQGDRGRAAAEGADRGAGGGSRADAARPRARGHHAKRRHARGRRDHRAGQAHAISRRSTAPTARPPR